MPDPAKSDGADVPGKLNSIGGRLFCHWYTVVVSCRVLSRQLHQANEQEVGTSTSLLSRVRGIIRGEVLSCRRLQVRDVRPEYVVRCVARHVWMY